MAVDAEELVIRPFREVVQRGNEAVDNAEQVFEEEGDGQCHDVVARRLAKAGQILRKEGERALKKLQPLWDDQAAKHGEGFKALMADNDEVAEKRRALDDLLYDFEDFIEVDTFDEAKCGELQAATKSLALAVIETIRRAKIEPSPVEAKSPSVFPPLPPLPPLPHSMTARPESRSSNLSSTQSVSRPSLKGKESWPRPPLSRHRNGMQDLFAYDGRGDIVPPLPPINLQYASNREKGGAESIATAMSSPTTPVSLSNDPGRSEMLRAEMERTTILETPPASPDVEKHFSVLGQKPSLQDRGVTFVPNKIDGPVSPPHDGRHDHRTSILDVSTIQTSNRASYMSNTTSISSRTGNSAMAPPASTTRTSSIQDASRPGLPGARVSSSISEHDNQIEKWSSVNTTDSQLAATLGYPRWRSVNVNIDPKAKSLCGGAKTFRTGGHWEGVKKVGGTSNTTSQANEYSFGQVYSSTPVIYADAMAQCRSCEYTHKHSQLSEDFDGSSAANFTCDSVRYRRRFLYKSHVATSNSSKAYYACVFCTMGGAKMHESDATTFATTAQLFSHLARHSQPLPDVSGVTVLYGTVPPDHAKVADYDINLTAPPSNNGVPEDASLGFLPVAIAVKDHFQEPGASRLQQPDRETRPLQFFSGGRIIGVTFPPQWDGKWCSGWHDGTFGAFPAKVVKLELPRRKGMPAPEKMESRRSGLARWKFKPKAGGNGGWLDFDKGDSITNLNWDDPEAWYWSGTNSKGQSGIFPSSHMKVESIQDGSLESDTARPASKKAARPSKSIFRLKRTSSAS